MIKFKYSLALALFGASFLMTAIPTKASSINCMEVRLPGAGLDCCNVTRDCICIVVEY